MEHRLAIVSGHRNSIGVLLDGGQISGTKTGTSLNLHAFTDQQLGDQISALLESLAASHFGGDGRRLLENADRFVVSLPGVAAHHDVERIRSLVKQLGWTRPDPDQLCIADDTWTGLLAGLQEDSGICAFSGTGASVLVSLDADSPKHWPYKLDGWGPVIGDFGSGFSLGHSMIQDIARTVDRYGEPSDLDSALTDIVAVWEKVSRQYPQLYALKTIQSWFDNLLRDEPQTWRLRIAELALFVTQAADADPPNQWAADLIRRAADEFAQTLRIAIDRFAPDTERMRITCQGGMFRHSRLYLERVRHKMQATTEQLDRAAYRPIVGACLLVASNSWRMPPADVAANLLRSIDNLPYPERRHFHNED